MTEDRTAPAADHITEPAASARRAQLVVTARRSATVPTAGVPP